MEFGRQEKNARPSSGGKGEVKKKKVLKSILEMKTWHSTEKLAFFEGRKRSNLNGQKKCSRWWRYVGPEMRCRPPLCVCKWNARILSLEIFTRCLSEWPTLFRHFLRDRHTLGSDSYFSLFSQIIQLAVRIYFFVGSQGRMCQFDCLT